MPTERHLHRSTIGGIGQYRASVDHPGAGHPFGWPLVVFPRTTLGLTLHRAGHHAVIDPTCAVLYRMGDESTVTWIDTEDRCDYVALRPDLYEHLCATDFGRGCFDRSIVQVAGAALVSWRAIVARLQRGEPVEDLEVQELTIALVATAAERSRAMSERPAPVSSRDRDLVDRARELIGADPAARTGIDDLAHQIGASSGHLARTFRRVTGTTLHAHRTELRLRRSLEELDDDLSAVALRWGFSSHSHYTDRMRACLGATPTVLRGRLDPATRRFTP